MAKMTDGRRVAMTEREVLQTVASFILREMKEELPGLVTVTFVKMPPDLRTAKIGISLLAQDGGDEVALRNEAVEILTAWGYEIQEHLNSTLKLRYCPKLFFVADESMEKALKIDGLLREISAKKESQE